MPYIRKHGTDPVTGKKLASGDLIKLKFHKNTNGDYFDPVSYKVFNEHTAITAVATSGNVFSKDTIDSLNVKPAFWRDLVDDTEFTRKDLIVLQDPHNLQNRDLSQFHYIRNDLKVEDERIPSATDGINMAAMGGTSKVFAQMQKGKEKEKARAEETEKTETAEAAESSAPKATVLDAKQLRKGHTSTPYNAAHFSTGKAAASFTSTGEDLSTKNERALINEDEYMFERILPGEKAYVALKTNLGTLNLELFCDKASAIATRLHMHAVILELILYHIRRRPRLAITSLCYREKANTTTQYSIGSSLAS